MKKKCLKVLTITAAGFSKQGGIFINGFAGGVTVLDKNGLLIKEMSNKYYDYPFNKINKRKPIAEILNYYYNTITKREIIVKEYKGQRYAINSNNTLRKKIPDNVLTNFLISTDKKGEIFFYQNYFKMEGDAKESNLYVLDSNFKLLNVITVYRKFSEGMWELISKEEIIGISTEGEIFYTYYVKGKFVKIYKLIPIDKNGSVR